MSEYCCSMWAPARSSHTPSWHIVKQLQAPYHGLSEVYSSPLVTSLGQHCSTWDPSESSVNRDGHQDPGKQTLAGIWWHHKPSTNQALFMASDLVYSHTHHHRRDAERKDWARRRRPLVNPTLPCAPGFYLPCQPWSLLNRFRTIQGTCHACHHRWDMAQSDLCKCSQRQMMTYIIRECPLTSFNGGLYTISRRWRRCILAKKHGDKGICRTKWTFLTSQWHVIVNNA